MPFLQDERNFVNGLLVIMKCCIDNLAVVLQGIQILKQLLVDEHSCEVLLSQFKQAYSFVFQLLVIHQDEEIVVRPCLVCLRQLLLQGDELASREEKRLKIQEVLYKPDLERIGPTLDRISKKLRLKNREELNHDLNKDIYSEAI
jgi:hypothetical protein